jgi:hypothetical protein
LEFSSLGAAGSGSNALPSAGEVLFSKVGNSSL